MFVLLSGFLSLGALAATPTSQPLSDLCNTTIYADVKLKHDLVCSGNGIIVGANDVEIDLNGHSITGPSRGAPFRGITVIGRAGVEITGPGVVTNFRTGILIMNSVDVEVEKVTVMGNGVRMFGDGDGIRIVSSMHVEVEKANVLSNGNDGIEILSSTDVELEKNLVLGNGNGIALRGIGNELEKNKIMSNACGVKGSTAGNVLSKNHIQGNVANFCA